MFSKHAIVLLVDAVKERLHDHDSAHSFKRIDMYASRSKFVGVDILFVGKTTCKTEILSIIHQSYGACSVSICK